MTSTEEILWRLDELKKDVRTLTRVVYKLKQKLLEDEKGN